LVFGWPGQARCPVSGSLADDDKAALLKIKQDAEKDSPPPAPKQDK
jgi:hypothetical protein